MKNNLFLLCNFLSLLFTSQIPKIEGYLRIPLRQEDPKLQPDDTLGAIFFDDFSSGLQDHWLGHTASFIPIDNRLHLVQRTSAPAFISASSMRIQNTIWEAGIQVDGPLSISNYIQLHMASTNPSLNESQQGYHLQIDGADGVHTYRLWRQNGNTRSAIFHSKAIPNQGNKFRARIRVVCNHEGQWQLFADEDDSGVFTAIREEDDTTVVTDVTYPSSDYTGFFINFSPTRTQDYKLDYLLIKSFDPAADSIQTGGIQPNDIIINEILANPKPDGVDFIEIYNYSNKTINLQHITISRVNSNGITGSRIQISDTPISFYPNEYKVLTIDPGIVKRHYPRSDPGAFIETPTLPDFNNELGGAVLYSGDLTIDSLFYTPAMRSPFITNHQGISLERQYFSMPTNDPNNFQSAATSAGSATPGYQNTQQQPLETATGIFLTSKTFSPDNDGFEDELIINYRFPAHGFMANIDIYNDKGVLAKQLQRNQSMAISGTIKWNGLSDTNQRLPVGIYIAVIEIYNAQGIRKVYRKSFVLATRL
ncbi:lamin tail domain-containing protein [Parapedobacter koreensis]|uniref:Lamin Tail Domain n=1 Tax=Parapedobacter koreensis TaxID=332977 RepID=A0A1H7SUU5_9SPHI|nr:lamin tail domain-containing protein [Parapedobacter koreensis]SEL76353.1 Lamin Tail Domain [Parapedobacter koreensis]